MKLNQKLKSCFHTLARVHPLALFSAVLFMQIGFALLGVVLPIPPILFLLVSLLISLPLVLVFFKVFEVLFINVERSKESRLRGGKKVVGSPPNRNAFVNQLESCKQQGKKVIDRYLVGFEIETGEPIWVNDDDMCAHGCVFAKTGVGKTLWLESLMIQQMARGRASGLTFIDAKRDGATLAHVILMALITGRIEDLIVIDPFEPIHAYNFVQTSQRADVKSRKVLRAGLPPTSEQSNTKHYDRLASDTINRIVRVLQSTGLAWNIRDVAVSLAEFKHSYDHLKFMLESIGALDAMVELGSILSSYADGKGGYNLQKMGDNLRGIASELQSISNSEIGKVFNTNYTDLVLTDDILRGKIIYYMLPRLEEAESAAKMVKIFREDLEISIGEITSSRRYHLEDPHLVIIDEGASTFGPTWANLFELARKGRFSILFGAQSTGGLTDQSLGLSEAFYERVMANVNLKVMMKIGDNRTALEMAEWFGKIKTYRSSYGSGSRSIGSSPFAGSAGSRTVTISEDEVDLVSADQLKHEMSDEKGLAWFDVGDGKIRKGRTFWFDAEISNSWEGREYLVKFEKQLNDGLGLSGYVDRLILDEQRNKGFSKPNTTPPEKVNKPNTNKTDPNKNNLQNTIVSNPKSNVKPSNNQPFRIKLNRGDKSKKRGIVSLFKISSNKQR
jgi:TraM recognition site of TraD and TraG